MSYRSKGSGRRGGGDLLRQVYAELYDALSGSYSPIELLKAAQAIIDATQSEYSDLTFADGLSYPGYYSYDVDSMITRNHWIVLYNEEHGPDWDEEIIISRSQIMGRVKKLHDFTPFCPFTDASLST